MKRLVGNVRTSRGAVGGRMGMQDIFWCLDYRKGGLSIKYCV